VNGGGFSLLGKQFVAVGVTIAFSFAVTFILLKVVQAVIGLRVTEDDEVAGLDLAQHAEAGYAFTEGAGSTAIPSAGASPSTSPSAVPVPRGSEA